MHHVIFINALFAAGLDFDHCDNSDTSQDQEDNKSKITVNFIRCDQYNLCQVTKQYSISLVPRPSPSFPSLAVYHIASDGKLGEGLGTRLVFNHR